MTQNNLLVKVIFSLMIVSTCAIASANNDDSSSHSKGWHWYDNEVDHKDEEQQTIDPIDQMNAENKAILRALYTARKQPTKENVKNYITMQKGVVKESKAFSNVWKAVLLENPDLDYSIEHPTNNFARMIQSDQENMQAEKTIHALAKQSGLFFFYRSTCPYCKAFASTVKQFADMYGIKVIPITTDGVALPEFPDSYVDQGQAEKFHVTVEPALFAVNPYTQKAFPITYGLISITDLKKRILDIATQFDGDVK